MRHTAIFAVTLAALLALGAPARAGMVEDCEQKYDWDLRIGGCTAMIRSGQWQGKELAWAYIHRGNAYANLSEYRRAIEDYDQARQQRLMCLARASSMTGDPSRRTWQSSNTLRRIVGVS